MGRTNREVRRKRDKIPNGSKDIDYKGGWIFLLSYLYMKSYDILIVDLLWLEVVIIL